MDLVIAKRDLLRLCNRCQGVADKKAAMPALSNILLTAEGSAVHASATDMFLSVTGQAAAEVRTAGSVGVPARDVLERVKAMPDGPLHVSTTAAGHTTIKAAGSPRRFTLHGIPGSDFPKLPAPDAAAPSVVLPVDVLLRLILRTHFSISTDETRPHVNSALFEWEGDKVRMVTTDGHRLSKVEITVPGMSASATMLVPLKAIAELRRLAEDARSDETKGETKSDRDPIRITQSGPHVFFEIAGTRLGVKLVDAQFPPYQQVIPRSSERTIRASRRAFADALDAVRIAASDRTGGVKITTAPGVLRITSESPESGNGFDEIPIEFSGGELTIGFNAKYFLDVLGAMDDDEILLNISGELDPAVLRPGAEKAEDAYLAVVMPMKI